MTAVVQPLGNVVMIAPSGAADDPVADLPPYMTCS